MTTNNIHLFAVTKRGVEQARRLRDRLRAGTFHRPESHGPSPHGWEKPYAGSLADIVQTHFAAADQLVFFLAVGAAVRLVAPLLGSKTTDPGVVAVDEAGRFAVPILSGHEGGANEFARQVAACLGAVPVITTASDVAGGFSLEQLARDWGWRLEPAEQIKPTALALVNAEPVAIVQEIGAPGMWVADLDLPAHVTCLRRGDDLEATKFAAAVFITDRLIDEPGVLTVRPRSLVLGVGCERGVSLPALEDGLRAFLEQHCFALASVGRIATIDIKQDEQAITALAEKLGCELAYFSKEELARIDAPSPSQVVQDCVGTPGVAEPAALLAAGVSRLLVDKQVMTSSHAKQRMTFALARDASYHAQIDQAGRVYFIGAGPGDPELLTLKARTILSKADVVVYAGSLVPGEILRHACPTAELHNSASLTLEEIMGVLIDAAGAGKRVARLQSGDTSIYSAIQEQMTRLDEVGIDYEVIPGISSFQAAAAELRSELTLPETVQTIILTRAEGQTKMPAGEELRELARHRASLCIFLSARLAEKVQADLLDAYPPETPVAILYRVTWPDERIVRTRLSELAETMKQEGFTRTTLILVGVAIGGRDNRSRLYDKTHGHIFRPRRKEESPPA